MLDFPIDRYAAPRRSRGIPLGQCDG